MSGLESQPDKKTNLGVSICNLTLDGTPDSGLCDQCEALINIYRNLDPSSDQSGLDKPLYWAHGLLEDNAETGCCLCQLFLEGIPADWRDVLRSRHGTFLAGKSQFGRQYYRYSWSPQENGRGLLKLCHLWKPWEEGDNTPAYDKIGHHGIAKSEIYVNVEAEGLSQEKINYKPLGLSTSSDEAMSTALEWIEHCRSKHTLCKPRSVFVPTRLIDCGSTIDQKCRLVIGSQLPPETKYATLSYRWGTGLPVVLLRDNLDSMMKSIPITTLPQTIQDAIATTRKLNAQYLWVDSLCIVQDDVEDWRVESSTMASVYSASYCNVSASASFDSSRGLFKRRGPLPFQQLKPKMNFGGKEQAYSLWNNNFWKGEIDGSPLNERGWVCQERILSPSNLHFGSMQLFWECGELSANEWYPLGWDNLSGSCTAQSWSGKKQFMFSTLGGAGGSPEDLKRAYETWQELIKFYASRKLTYAKDKLVAVSGMARKFGAVIQDQYLAGLWRNDLDTQLLWSCANASPYNENREYTAPSWSWASVDGNLGQVLPLKMTALIADIEPHFASIKNHLDIVTASTENVNDDVYGAVIRGSITLRASLAALKFGEDFKVEAQTLPGAKDIPSFSIVWDCGSQHAGQLAKADELQGLCALFVQTRVHGHRGARGVRTILAHGLVICPTSNHGVYRRVGSFRCGYATQDAMRASMRNTFRHFDSLADKHGLKYIRELGQEGFESYKYSITLV